MPINWCKGCSDRNRQSAGVRKVGGDWFCTPCFKGYENGVRACVLCGRNLRANNIQPYCSLCSQNGSAYRDIRDKEKAAKEAAKSSKVITDESSERARATVSDPSPIVGEEVVSEAVPAD